MIRSNQIKNFPVTVQDVEVDQKVRGKKILALKGKTTWKNPNVVARDQVKIPVGLKKLQKEVFLTCNLTFSWKIYFTAVDHLENCTVPKIFKSFKEVYQYYLHHGFRIITVHTDGKFEPLKSLIGYLPGGALINLVAANKHVPDIKRQIRVMK